MAKPNKRDYTIPKDLAERTFLDALADVFTAPEDLQLRRPVNGNEGFIQDAERIRGYFDKAMGVEETHQENYNSRHK